eukprot:14687412-Heterocapsa_arctica.AAC.1
MRLSGSRCLFLGVPLLIDPWSPPPPPPPDPPPPLLLRRHLTPPLLPMGPWCSLLPPVPVPRVAFPPPVVPRIPFPGLRIS